jgi:hypothetical protein
MIFVSQTLSPSARVLFGALVLVAFLGAPFPVGTSPDLTAFGASITFAHTTISLVEVCRFDSHSIPFEIRSRLSGSR